MQQSNDLLYTNGVLMILDNLIEASTLSGFHINDMDQYKRIVHYQLNNGQFEFIEVEGKTIGFFGWLTRKSLQGICVCINNLFVLDKYKKDFNIFDMCKFFRSKYEDIYELEWHNQKKDKFRRLVLKGRK